jgi:type IX secretion system PorP/SprF family membrane protein
MRKLLLIALFGAALFLNRGTAQNVDIRDIHTHHIVNPILLNPGATGFNDAHELLFAFRSKWSSFPGAPKAITFSYNGPVGNNIGLGAMLQNDNYGGLEATRGQLSFAYILQGVSSKIGFGLTTEYIQYRLDRAAITNPLNDGGDPLLLERLDGAQFFDATFGVHGEFNENIHFGLAFPGLIRSRIDETSSTVSDEKPFNYIFNIGYDIDVTGYDLFVTPSLYVKKLRNAPLNYEFNVVAQFLEKKLTGGLSYEAGADNRLGFIVGTKINNFKFYYSYAVSFREFQDYNNGSHEVSIGFDLASFKNAEN